MLAFFGDFSAHFKAAVTHLDFAKCPLKMRLMDEDISKNSNGKVERKCENTFFYLTEKKVTKTKVIFCLSSHLLWKNKFKLPFLSRKVSLRSVRNLLFQRRSEKNSPRFAKMIRIYETKFFKMK